MVKNFILATIAGLGIAGLVFVLQHTKSAPSPAASEIRTRPSEQILAGNNLVSDRPFVEQLDEKSLKALVNKEGIDSQRGEGGTENLTEEFTKTLAEKIAEENPDGLLTQDGKKFLAVPDPNQIALELLADAASKFDLKGLIPKIEDERLKISEEISPENKVVLNYTNEFNKIIEIIKKTKDEIAKTDEEFNENTLDKIIKTYQGAITSLYNLKIPRVFLDFHKTEIAYLSAELTFLKKIRNFEQDPMGAILASTNLPLLNQEFINQINIQTLKILDPNLLNSIISKN